MIERRGIGPVAAIIILVLLFAAGGLYFIYEQHARFTAPPVHETINA